MRCVNYACAPTRNADIAGALGLAETLEPGTVLLVAGGVAIGVAQLVILAYILVAYYEGQAGSGGADGRPEGDGGDAADEGKKDK